MMLIILIIFTLLMFIFGGHILIGLICITPITIIYFMCTKFNLPNFVFDFLGFIYCMIIAYLALRYRANIGKEQSDKK